MGGLLEKISQTCQDETGLQDVHTTSTISWDSLTGLSLPANADEHTYHQAIDTAATGHDLSASLTKALYAHCGWRIRDIRVI